MPTFSESWERECARFQRGKLPRITQACGNRLVKGFDDSPTWGIPETPARRGKADDGALRGRKRGNQLPSWPGLSGAIAGVEGKRIKTPLAVV